MRQSISGIAVFLLVVWTSPQVMAGGAEPGRADPPASAPLRPEGKAPGRYLPSGYSIGGITYLRGASPRGLPESARDYFWGSAPSAGPGKVQFRLYEYDPAARSASPLLPEDQFSALFADVRDPRSCRLILSPEGSALLIRCLKSNFDPDNPPNPRPRFLSTSNLLLVDLATRRVKVLVADGLMNFGCRFSPDGKHIAYYANPAEFEASLGDSPCRSARIVDTATGKITVVSGYFLSSGGDSSDIEHLTWMDNERVYFPYANIEPDLRKRPVFRRAIAYASTRTVKFLDLPGECVPDPAGKRLLFRSREGVLATDADGENLREVVKGGVKNLRVENGELRYDPVTPTSPTLPAAGKRP